MLQVKQRARVLALGTLCFVLASLVCGAARGQYFGKNKVRYDSFDWSVIETDNFHVYFYVGEERAARDAARMAERAYSRLSRILDHDVIDPIPLILYASHTDFQQTNALPGLIDEGTGGVTEFSKRRVILPFTGCYADLDHVLTHELVHAFQLDILFGPRYGTSSFAGLETPPLWFMEGMAEYISRGGVDNHTAMWLRDASLEGYLIPLDDLSYASDIRVYRFGQSIIAFIAERYGLDRVSELLKKTARDGDVERAIQVCLGISIADLSDHWIEHVENTYFPDIARFQTADDYGPRLTSQEDGLARLNLAPSVSPDGKLMVFLSDRSLFHDAYLASAIDGRIVKRLVKGERSAGLESLRFLSAAFSWSPDQSMIALIAKKGGEDAICLVEISDARIRHRLSFGFDRIQGPSFSPDGGRLVFVGFESGHSDLFITDIDGKELRRLTNDRYAEHDPQWSPDGTRIAFATDRGAKTDFEALEFDRLHIAIYDLETDQVHLPFPQMGKNIAPCWSPDGTKIAYVSDRMGHSNIFITDLTTSETYQLTNLLTGVTGIVDTSAPLTWSANGERMLLSVFGGGSWDIFAIENPLDLLERRSAAPTTLAGRATDRLDNDAGSRLPSPGKIRGELTGATLRHHQIRSSRDEVAPDQESATITRGDAQTTPRSGNENASAVDSRPDARDPADEEPAIDIAYRPPAPDDSSFRVRDYQLDFSPDALVGGGNLTTGRGLAGQFTIALSDLLGNHRIQMSTNTYGDLNESDLFLSYLNLSRRTSWSISFFQFRNSLLSFEESALQRDDREQYRGIEFFVSRPFSKYRRIEIGIQGATVQRLGYGLGVDESRSSLDVDLEGQIFFIRPQAALVADNVFTGSTGPISGSRARLSLDRSFGSLQFTTALLDVRKYINIRRRYVVALRAMGAISSGETPEHFRIGGPYTVRGYDFEELRGNRVGIANLEFRFPFIEELRLDFPLPLDFRGIQGVLFLDAGAALDQHERRDDGGGARTAWIRRRDLAASYGFGARLNLGYFIARWDLAQKTDLTTNRGRPRSSFTIGANF